MIDKNVYNILILNIWEKNKTYGDYALNVKWTSLK